VVVTLRQLSGFRTKSFYHHWWCPLNQRSSEESLAISTAEKVALEGLHNLSIVLLLRRSLSGIFVVFPRFIDLSTCNKSRTHLSESSRHNGAMISTSV